MAEPTWDVLYDLIRRFDPHFQPHADARPVAMPGGASTRRFFRVKLGGRSAVAMFVPGPATHELHKDPIRSSAGRWPFIEVRDLLAERGIRVPAIYADGTCQGWLLVEDLGDDTIAEYLVRCPGAKQAVYQKAVLGLARAQRALATLPQDCIVRMRALDRDLLRLELDHFREWALEARGIQLTPDDRASFSTAADRIASRIASWPRAFVHRDYQSRNLMLVPRLDGSLDLAWIDFQDALLGPRVYDLAALLSDSYQVFEPEFVERRLDEYAREIGCNGDERAQLRREFDLVTVHRKLKDAGRFVYIDQVHENPSFLCFVEPTIAKARAALARLSADPEMARFASWLDRVLAGH